jgi:hypothetical protein
MKALQIVKGNHSIKVKKRLGITSEIEKFLKSFKKPNKLKWKSSTINKKINTDNARSCMR